MGVIRDTSKYLPCRVDGPVRRQVAEHPDHQFLDAGPQRNRKSELLRHLGIADVVIAKAAGHVGNFFI
jgi:hypothetical protein